MKVYPNGAKKALTFSYDDGVEQDIRLVELFNKYGIKGTFNLNFGLMGKEADWKPNGLTIKRLSAETIETLYKGHEIACHGLLHKGLQDLSFVEKENEILKDKQGLEQLLKRKITGMAYAFGDVDDESIEIMKENELMYGRTVADTQCFQPPKDFYRWAPTIHHNNKDIFDRIKTYKTLASEELSLFYIWGHSYEFDVDNNWEHIEKCLQLLAGQEDIWYCTNQEYYEFMRK